MECSECSEFCESYEFSSNQWAKGRSRAKCRNCVNDSQREVSCPFCGRSFNCQNSLNMHRPSCVPTCSQCSRTFGSQHSLDQHMKSHRPREIQCPLCHGAKRFRNGANVVAHVESGYCSGCRGEEFAKERIFDFVSRNARSLVVPMLQNGDNQTTTRRNPYQCTYCHKTFAQLSAQMNHEEDVHGNQRSMGQTLGIGY